MSQTILFFVYFSPSDEIAYQCFSTSRWKSVIPNEMITVDAVATAAMVRFGNDAELDVTEIDKLEL